MDQECKHCKAKEIDVYGNATGVYIKGIKSEHSAGMWLYITNGKHILRSHASGGYNEILVNYCPMCGRKLNDTK